MKHLFIVGCPRSGTTWVSTLIARQPGTVVSFHGSLFGLVQDLVAGIGRRNAFGNRVLAPRGDPHEQGAAMADLLSGRELVAACRPLVLAAFETVHRANPKASWVVDVTPEHLLLADLIREILPEARFLHVVRDPRAVFSSMRSAARDWASDFPTTPNVFTRRFWLRYIAAGEALAGTGAAYRVLRYEGLSEDPAAEIDGVLEWLGLSWSAGERDRAIEACSIASLRQGSRAPSGFFRNGSVDSWRRELSAWQIRVVEHLAGDVMERLGYECSRPRSSTPPLRLRFADGYSVLRGRIATTLLGSRTERLRRRSRQWMHTGLGAVGERASGVDGVAGRATDY